MIDIDATIVTCRSDKHEVAGTWKRTYGFHPLVAVNVARREVLAQLACPGHAGSNTSVDHVEVLGAAIGALPEGERAGRCWDDDGADLVCQTVLRTDAGGQTHWLAEECVDRSCALRAASAAPSRSITAMCRPAVDVSITSSAGRFVN